MTYRDDATALPASAFVCEPSYGKRASPDVKLASEADTRVFDYVVAAQGRFDGLRQCAAQIAGLLVLAAAGGSTDPGHPMLELARNAHGAAADATYGAKAPAGAEHHHRQLAAAAKTLAVALKAMPDALSKRGEEAVDKAFGPLQAGFRELQNASCCLPGFEIIDFEQGCFAAHVGLRRSSTRCRNASAATTGASSRSTRTGCTSAFRLAKRSTGCE